MAFYLFSKKFVSNWSKQREYFENLRLKNLQEVFSGFMTVKIFQLEKTFIRDFVNKNSFYDYIKKERFVGETPRIFLEIFYYLMGRVPAPLFDTQVAAMVCGFGDVGKGSADSLANEKARVMISEVDPICALQACMAGFEVTTVEDALETADIFVTTTGNKDIITAEHMSRMKDQAIVCNIGHFDNEIQVAKLEAMDGVVKEVIKEDSVPGGPVSRFTFPDGRSIYLLAEGRLINLGCATGHPSFVMSNSFTNQTIAQIDIRQNPDRKIGVYRLSKELDEEVARLHLDKLGAKLTKLSDEQADYIGVPVEGPYKPEHYRY